MESCEVSIQEVLKKIQVNICNFTSIITIFFAWVLWTHVW